MPYIQAQITLNYPVLASAEPQYSLAYWEDSLCSASLESIGSACRWLLLVLVLDLSRRNLVPEVSKMLCFSALFRGLRPSCCMLLRSRKYHQRRQDTILDYLVSDGGLPSGSFSRISCKSSLKLAESAGTA